MMQCALLLLLAVFLPVSGESHSCRSNQVPVQIARTYSANGHKETIELWKKSSTSGNLILFHNGRETPSSTQVIDICVERTVYFLVLSDSSSNGWDIGSRISVKLFNSVVLIDSTLDRFEKKTFWIDCAWFSSPLSSWRYSDSYSADWNLPSFEDTHWNSAAAGYFPSIPSSVITRYYRHTLSSSLTREEINQFVGFRLSGTTQTGFICYINGVEILRQNLPSGTIHDHIPATVSFPSPLTYSSTQLDTSILMTGANVIGCEVHDITNHLEHDDPFQLFTYLLPTDHHGFASSIPMELTYSIDPSLDLSNLVDDDWRTAVTLQVNSYLRFTVPYESRDLINAYSLSIPPPSSSSPNQPLAWTLEGSHNYVTWTPLDSYEVNSSFFTSHKSFTRKLPYQMSAYSVYRVQFTKSDGNHPFELSEFRLLLHRPSVNGQLPSLSSLSLQYPQQALALFPGQHSIHLAPSIPGFYGFTMEGLLPEGLQFSSSTGVFTGSIPDNTVSQYAQFTITAKHGMTGDLVHMTGLTIPILFCGGSQSYSTVEFRFQCMRASSGAFWELTWSESNILASQSCEDVLEGDSAVFITTLCLLTSTYTLTLGTTSLEDGWASGTSLRVNILTRGQSGGAVTPVDHSIRLGELALPRGQYEASFPLSLLVMSAGELADWTYYSSSTVPADWYKASCSSGWSFFPSSSATLTRSVWLLRRTFTLSSLLPIQSLDMEIWAAPGLVIYLNDAEIYRTSVPGGPVQEGWTAVVSPSGGGTSWHVLRVAVDRANLRVGTNLLSVAVVHETDGPHFVDYVCLAVGSAHGSYLSRLSADDAYHTTHFITDSDHLAGHAATLLFDASLATTYQARAGLNAYSIDIQATPRRQEVFNQYCVTASLLHRTHDPIQWVLQSGDGEGQWYPLHTVTGILFAPGERKCFVIMPSFFDSLRLQITSVRGASTLALAEMGIYYKEVPSTIVPPLQVTNPQVTLYLDVFGVTTFLSDTEYYQSFTISPALPAGVYLDISTGRLFGTPSSLSESTTFTIEGTTENGLSSAQAVQIAVVECASALQRMSLLTIDVTGLSTKDRCKVIVENIDGLVMMETVEDLPAREFHRSLCIPSNMYKLFFITQLEGGITYAYRLSNHDVHTGLIEPSASLTSFSFTTEIPIPTEIALWRYWLADSQPPTDWYQSGISETWEKAVVGDLPPMAGITAYYCTTFSASYSADVSAFSVGAYLTGGAVMYLNGIEINRVNLPSGDLTPHTLPLNTTAVEASTIIFTGSIQFLPFSVDPSAHVADAPIGHNNRFCMEVHRPSQSAEPNSFRAYMEYVYEGSNRVIDGEPWGSVAGVAAPWFEYIENAFDQDPGTKFFGRSTCNDIAVRWTYHAHRKEFVNYLRFYAGNLNERRPLNLRLEGSDNELAWTPLLEVSGLTWTGGGYGQWQEWSFNNTHSYHSYQLVGDDCLGSDGMEFAEVILQTRRSPIACEAKDGFPAALEGDTSYGPCPEYYSGSATRICQNGKFSEIDLSTCVPFAPSTLAYSPSSITVFTHTAIRFIPSFSFHVDIFRISPMLPTGVTLDMASGVISGTPVIDSPYTVYTITAQNERGEARATIHLYVKSGCVDISDFPATSVGSTEVYYCSRKSGMYGRIYRTCLEVDGVPTWSAPEGSCKNVFTTVMFIIMFMLILAAIVGTWTYSESVNQHVQVYELPNGEYELEEMYGEEEEEEEEEGEGGEEEGEGGSGGVDDLEEGDSLSSSQTAPRLHHRHRQRVKPRMKLLGRPVFIYLPRYFKRRRRDYNYMYHPAPKLNHPRI